MTVDHGLGGKDCKKSRMRREKNSKRLKSQARAVALQASLSEEGMAPQGKKGEIVFNEAARVAWLTGFRKRKQERRKYGLAMQVEAYFADNYEAINWK